MMWSTLHNFASEWKSVFDLVAVARLCWPFIPHFCLGPLAFNNESQCDCVLPGSHCMRHVAPSILDCLPAKKPSQFNSDDHLPLNITTTNHGNFNSLPWWFCLSAMSSVVSDTVSPNGTSMYYLYLQLKYTDIMHYSFHTRSCLGRLHAVCLEGFELGVPTLILTWLHCALPAHFQGDHLYCQPCQESGQGTSQTCDCATLFQISYFQLISTDWACTWLPLELLEIATCHLVATCSSVAVKCEDSTTEPRMPSNKDYGPQTAADILQLHRAWPGNYSVMQLHKDKAVAGFSS